MPNLTDSIDWRGKILPPAVILAVAVLIALVIFFYPQIRNFLVKTTPVPSPKLEVFTAESGQLPPDLPKDIVLDENARILRGTYTQPFSYPQGRGTIYQVQSSLAFATDRSVADIFSLYRDYLKNNKWEAVTVSLNEKSTKRLTALKSSDKIAITISKNSLTDDTTVDIFNLHIGMWRSLRSPSPSPSPTPNR